MSKVKVEIVLANAEPLMVGKVDYFSGYINNQTYQIEVEAAKPNAPANLKGKVWKAILFSKYGVEGYGDVLFATSKTIRDNPELVRKFMRAAVRGLKIRDRKSRRGGQGGRRLSRSGRTPRQAHLALQDSKPAVGQRRHQNQRADVDAAPDLGSDDGVSTSTTSRSPACCRSTRS